MPSEFAPGIDRRALIRRLAVGGAVVWASPMMQSVASAQAVQSCSTGPVVLNWDAFATNTVFSSATVAGLTVTITAVAGGGATLWNPNRVVRDGPSGGVNEKYLRFEMVPNAQNIFQTITITFSRPVTNLSFEVFDIDSISNPGWRDELLLPTTGTTWSIPAGSAVARVGTTTPPLFRNNNNNNNVDYTSPGGNLNVFHVGSTSSLVMTYRNGNQTGGGNQYIGIGDITFNC